LRSILLYLVHKVPSPTGICTFRGLGLYALALPPSDNAMKRCTAHCKQVCLRLLFLFTPTYPANLLVLN